MEDVLGKPLINLVLLLCLAASLVGQALPSASKSGDLFLGAGYVRANPDYSPATFQGFSLFATADLSTNFGAEAKFHHISGPASDAISETTYELGLRARTHLGPVVPFLEILAGLGSFSYQKSLQNGTYGIFAGGGGIDYKLSRKFILRGEYEYQKWSNFPPRGLQPNLASVGIGYRLQ